jgi:superfamily II DNA helicase RecQ
LLTLFSSIVRTQLIKLLTRTKGSAKEKVTTDNGIEEGCLATGNVIVYVWRQRDAEAVAENLQASGVEGGIVVYHGGMDSGARSKSQSMVSAWSSPICLFRLLIRN